MFLKIFAIGSDFILVISPFADRLSKASNFLKIFAMGSDFFLVISPLEGAILLQHVERLQLPHNIVALCNPLLSLK